MQEPLKTKWKPGDPIPASFLEQIAKWVSGIRPGSPGIGVRYDRDGIKIFLDAASIVSSSVKPVMVTGGGPGEYHLGDVYGSGFDEDPSDEGVVLRFPGISATRTIAASTKVALALAVTEDYEGDTTSVYYCPAPPEADRAAVVITGGGPGTNHVGSVYVDGIGSTATLTGATIKVMEINAAYTIPAGRSFIGHLLPWSGTDYWTIELPRNM